MTQMIANHELCIYLSDFIPVLLNFNDKDSRQVQVSNLPTFDD